MYFKLKMKFFHLLMFSLLHTTFASDFTSTFTFESTTDGQLELRFKDLTSLPNTGDGSTDISANGDECDESAFPWMPGTLEISPVTVIKSDMYDQSYLQELRIACLDNNYVLKNLKIIFKHEETVSLPPDLTMFATLRVKVSENLDEWEDLRDKISFTRSEGTYDLEVQLKDPDTPTPAPTVPVATCDSVDTITYQNAGCCSGSDDLVCTCFPCPNL